MSCDRGQRVSTPASSIPPLHRSLQRPDAAAVGPRKKADQRVQLLREMTLSEGLLCADYHDGLNVLAIGSTKAIHLAEVVQTQRRASPAGDEQPTSSSSFLNESVSLMMRPCGMFGNVARVESLAWHPNRHEAVLAIVQLSRKITVLFDALAKKGDVYMPQQWSHTYRSRTLVSSTVAGSEPLDMAVVGAPSRPSTPFNNNNNNNNNSHAAYMDGAGGAQTTVTCVERDPSRPCSMVEVVIETGDLRVERIAWDPHNMYTLALTSNSTHFELWCIPVVRKRVYAPQLILRPPAHREESTTRGVAFSPFDPHLIIVVVEIGNAGKVILYDRRHVEIFWCMKTSGPCLAVNFHPVFSDLLAVCFRKEKTKTSSRVEFYRVRSDVITPPSKTTDTPHNNDKSVSVTATLEPTDVLPRIDSIDSLSRLRWRPSGGTVDWSEGEIDAVSSKLWFATTALNGYEISVWDAANGFSPVFSIRSVNNKCQVTHKGSSSSSSYQRELTLQETTDCVWVNPLTIVSVYKNGMVILTSLLDETTTSKDTLFRCITDNNNNISDSITNTNNININNNNNSNTHVSKGSSDILSLGAILPTSAVVTDYYGRCFMIRNTSSLLREYYTRIINADKMKLLEQLTSEKERNSMDGGEEASARCMSESSNYCNVSNITTTTTMTTTTTTGVGKSPSILVMNSLGACRSCKDSSRTTPTSSSLQHAGFLRRSPASMSGISPHIETSNNNNNNNNVTATNAITSSVSKPLEFIFPFLLSLTSSRALQQQQPSSSSSTALDRPVNIDADVTTRRLPKAKAGVQSDCGLREKSGAVLPRRGGDSVLTVNDQSTFGEPNEMRSNKTSVTHGVGITGLDSPTQSEEVFTKRKNLFTSAGEGNENKAPGMTTIMMQEAHGRCANVPSEFALEGISAEENNPAPPPLGEKSFVNPKIESFLLSHEMCGWAYVERACEEETFVSYASKWEMGYDVARKMKASRYAVSEESFHADAAESVDHYFSRIMMRNAKVCRAREGELQKEMEMDMIHDNNNNNNSGGANSLASVDPRSRLWAAAAHVWRSHNVPLIASVVCSQLDYASLLADVQYCAVLYLLFCLWWKQRGITVECYPCPLFTQDSKFDEKCPKESRRNQKSLPGSSSGSDNNDNNNNNNNNNNSRSSNGSSPWEWEMRAQQWVNEYVSRLHERKLYVPFNELLIIVPEVMGNTCPGLLHRAEDNAQKLFTCVYCGTCPNSDLKPQTSKYTRLMLMPRPTAAEVDENDGNLSDDVDNEGDNDSDNSFGSSLVSSSLCTCIQDSTTESGVFNDSVTAAVKEKVKGDGWTDHFPNNNKNMFAAAPLRNAICCSCHSTSIMTCVICEEVVEGMYLWLLSCGHGGHIHHVQKWLQISNECPRCGIPVLQQSEQTKRY